MSTHAELTHEIDESPSGPATAAFFDLDRTLIEGFSALTFVRAGMTSGLFGAAQIFDLTMAAASFEVGTLGFSAFMSGMSQALRGIAEQDLRAFGEHLFAEQIAARIFPEARALVEAHRRRGHTLAVVSSATPFQVDPVARSLGIPHVMATRLESRDGKLTGKHLSPACWGEGKATAAHVVAAEQGCDLGQSFFYTDSDEDLPLLEIVGRPRPVNPTGRLARIAARRGWPSRNFARRSLPTLDETLRTGMALASFGPALLLSLPAWWATGEWQRALNLATSTFSELATALAGIEVRVQGEENLWSQRPAVFVFNHQSGLDALLIAKLLRRDFVGISKAELQSNPFFGPLLRLAGTVFVDRFDHDRAIEALRPAVDALRSGLSLAIAPEGTRSATPLPGPFKKGAFVMAMAAGVPIVPIVLRNPLEALPRHWLVVRPATIDVTVLPPIPTTGWTHDDLDRRIAELRQIYLETLGPARASVTPARSP